MLQRVYIGYDARERLAWQVCAASLQDCAADPVAVEPIGRPALEKAGLYQRPTSIRDGRLWDDISGAPCSTDFSIARFWAAALAGRTGWALFCDGDFLWRRDVGQLFALADHRYAVMVVPHQHAPTEPMKMDGQIQTVYERKNWSSLVLWNLAHAGAQRLNHFTLNTRPGRDLHRFCWLRDEEIGFLPETWNWLDGHSDPALDPAAVHFTRGTPDMPGWEFTRYSREWCGYAQAFSRKAA
jgi:hypothetical protein